MKIIHVALCFGVLMFLIVSLLLLVENPQLRITNIQDDTEFLLLTVLIILSIGVTFVGKKIQDHQLKRISMDLSVKEKINRYQTAMIIRLALLEGASLFGVVSFMNTENLFFAILSGLILIFMFALHPQKSMVANALNLKEEAIKNFDAGESN